VGPLSTEWEKGSARSGTVAERRDAINVGGPPKPVRDEEREKFIEKQGI